MSATPGGSRQVLPRTPRRLLRNEAGTARQHVHGAIVVAALVVLALVAWPGTASPAIALLAAGAGAGYSLSGSV